MARFLVVRVTINLLYAIGCFGLWELFCCNILYIRTSRHYIPSQVVHRKIISSYLQPTRSKANFSNLLTWKKKQTTLCLFGPVILRIKISAWRRTAGVGMGSKIRLSCFIWSNNLRTVDLFFRTMHIVQTVINHLAMQEASQSRRTHVSCKEQEFIGR